MCPEVNDRQPFVVSRYILPIRVKCCGGGRVIVGAPRRLKNPSYISLIANPDVLSFTFQRLDAPKMLINAQRGKPDEALSERTPDDKRA